MFYLLYLILGICFSVLILVLSMYCIEMAKTPNVSLNPKIELKKFKKQKLNNPYLNVEVENKTKK